jgi:hypothetical protein
MIVTIHYQEIGLTLLLRCVKINYCSISRKTGPIKDKCFNILMSFQYQNRYQDQDQNHKRLLSHILFTEEHDVKFRMYLVILRNCTTLFKHSRKSLKEGKCIWTQP